MMSTTTDCRDANTTTLPSCVQHQKVQHDQADETSVDISRDLRHAIDLLRAVPSAYVRSHNRHDANDRLPLRPVNQHAHRLSLPPQLPQTDVVSDHLPVRQCSSLTDDVIHAADALNRAALQAAARSDCSSDASRYVLPWKIRRVKKHRLGHVSVDSTSSSSTYMHHHQPAMTSAAASNDDVQRGPRRIPSVDDSDDDLEMDEGRQSASNESLDTIVERILENAALDSQRRKSSKRKHQDEKMARSGSDWREDKYEIDRLPNNEQRITETNMLSSRDRRKTSSSKQKHSQQNDGVKSSVRNQQKQRLKMEKTLEDLFEEAVESMRDDVQYLPESPASPVRRRLRSSENWEKQIYDSELHEECRHYRLQAYTSRDVSHVSRGFAVVQKLRKQTSDLETSRKNTEQHSEQPSSKPTSSRSATQCRDDAGDAVCLQRTVISAKVASNDSRQAAEDGVDLGLEMELAANQRQRTSRSSSATWDSVSVDSLVMYDDDEETVHAAAIYSSGTRDLDDQFVNKLRQLQDKWQTQSTMSTGADDDPVWVRMSPHSNEHSQRNNISRDTVTRVTDDVHYEQATEVVTADSVTCDSRQPETDTTMTSPEDVDSAAVLYDSVTTQEVVINIKLPRSYRRRPRHSASTCSKQRTPNVPFRELRLRREIRYFDDGKVLDSTSAVVNDANSHTLVTSSRDNDDVTMCKVNDADKALMTTENSVMLTANSLLGDEDLSTLLSNAEIEYNNKDSSRSVELVPVYDIVGRPTSQPVDVSRSEATRVFRLPSTSSSQLMYITPSLVQIVDDIRRALLTEAPQARADGVAVSCEAAETVTRRGDTAPVVCNIVVDCLPPHHSHHHHDDVVDDDDDDDSGNTASLSC